MYDRVVRRTHPDGPSHVGVAEAHDLRRLGTVLAAAHNPVTQNRGLLIVKERADVGERLCIVCLVDKRWAGRQEGSVRLVYQSTMVSIGRCMPSHLRSR